MERIEEIYRLIKITKFTIKELNIEDPSLSEYINHLIKTKSLNKLNSFIESSKIKKIEDIFVEEKENKEIQDNKIIINDNFPRFLVDLKKKAIESQILVVEPEEGEKEVHQNNVFSLINNNLLPIESKIDEIVETLETHQVVLIQGDTGSGKSTQVPKYLLKHYKSIICTQPRRVAAVNVAKKVASDYNSKLGDIVGYKIRFEEQISKNTKLIFVTDGVLLRECIKDRLLSKYDVIIIDEAHERTINTDLLLGYCKFIISQRCDVKIVIMSATLSTKKFKKFFNCPLIECYYKMYPVDIFYIKTKEDSYFEETLKTVYQIHKTKPKGDILAFLTGQEEIEEAFQILKTKISGKEAVIFKIYSSMAFEEQQLIFKKYNERKIILSTNISETSITIEGLTYVVDCGCVKQKRFSPQHGMNILETVKISKAQAKQRAGRTGRTAPGEVYRIYSKEEYKSMSDERDPETKRTNLVSLVLTLKAMNIKDIFDFQFIDKPNAMNVYKAQETLYILQALDSDGYITPLGLQMAEMPLDPHLSKALITGSKLGCMEELLIICAMLSIQNVFIEISKEDRRYNHYERTREKYMNPKGDHFAYLMIYKNWSKSNYSFEYCKINFLNYKNLLNAKMIKNQLFMMFKKYKTQQKMNDELIIESLAAGYFMNTARKISTGFKTLVSGEECFIHPKSFVNGLNSNYILYNELVYTKKEYMRHCLVIKHDILMKVSNSFFKLDNKYNSKFKLKNEINKPQKKIKTMYDIFE